MWTAPRILTRRTRLTRIHLPAHPHPGHGVVGTAMVARDNIKVPTIMIDLGRGSRAGRG